MNEDVEVPKEIEECRKILSERFPNYLIIAEDGEHIFRYFTSPAWVIGICDTIREFVRERMLINFFGAADGEVED